MMREQDHNRKSELLLQAIGELPDEMIAQAAPQNLPFTKHRGAKLLRPQMFPAAAMVGIGIGLCLLARDGGQFELHSKSSLLSRSAGDRLRKRKRRQQGIRLL